MAARRDVSGFILPSWYTTFDFERNLTMKRACDEPEGDSKRVLAGDREPIDYERDLRRRYQWAENRNWHESETVLKYFDAARLPAWLGCNQRTAFDLMYPWLIEVLVARPPPYLAWIEYGAGHIRRHDDGTLLKFPFDDDAVFGRAMSALTGRRFFAEFTPVRAGRIKHKRKRSWLLVQTGLIEATLRLNVPEYDWMNRKVWLHRLNDSVYGVFARAPQSAPHKVAIEPCYIGVATPKVSVHLAADDTKHVQAYFNQITNLWHPSSIEFYT